MLLRGDAQIQIDRQRHVQEVQFVLVHIRRFGDGIDAKVFAAGEAVLVATRAADLHVVTWAALQQIVARAGEELIVARAANQHVVQCVPCQLVVLGRTDYAADGTLQQHTTGRRIAVNKSLFHAGIVQVQCDAIGGQATIEP